MNKQQQRIARATGQQALLLAMQIINRKLAISPSLNLSVTMEDPDRITKTWRAVITGDSSYIYSGHAPTMELALTRLANDILIDETITPVGEQFE